MNNKHWEIKEILTSQQQSYPLFQRLKSDFMAAILTLCIAAMCLGVTVLYFAILSQPLILSPAKSIRWFQVVLPIGAFLVFVFSYFRAMPWFAGILASLIASQVPGLSIVVRVIIMVLLSVIFGVLDWLIRRNR